MGGLSFFSKVEWPPSSHSPGPGSGGKELRGRVCARASSVLLFLVVVCVNAVARLVGASKDGSKGADRESYVAERGRPQALPASAPGSSSTVTQTCPVL